MYETIEELRCRMIELAEEKGHLSDPAVLAISRKLDSIIIVEQRRRMNSIANSQRNVCFIWQSSKTRFKDFISRCFELV